MIIPGRGRLADEYDLSEYRDMLTIIRDRVQAMIKQGASFEQVKTARLTTDYDTRYGTSSGAWTTDMFLEAIYTTVKKQNLTIRNLKFRDFGSLDPHSSNFAIFCIDTFTVINPSQTRYFSLFFRMGEPEKPRGASEFCASCGFWVYPSRRFPLPFMTFARFFDVAANFDLSGTDARIERNLRMDRRSMDDLAILD